jgi:hypothetical protein
MRILINGYCSSPLFVTTLPFTLKSFAPFSLTSVMLPSPLEVNMEKSGREYLKYVQN